MSITGRMTAIAGLVFACVMLRASPGRAGEGTIRVPESVVRTAPFDVAPEIGRVHAGDRLYAEDQPSGTWRRVQLPDGRFGFVNDADVAPVAAPAAPPAGPAAGPTTPAGGSTAPAGGPTAPAGGSAAPTDGSGAPAGGSAAPVSTEQPTPVANAPSLVGVVLHLMPAGSLLGSESMGTRLSSDTTFAWAVAPFVDFAVSPYVALGVSPQLIFRVKGDGVTSQSATEFDVRARLTGRVPVSDSSHVYGRLSPGFSIISMPASAMDVASDPQGFVVDVAVGAEFALLPKLFLVVDLGYQFGFQTGTMESDAGVQEDFDVHTRYLHVGSGLALRL